MPAIDDSAIVAACEKKREYILSNLEYGMKRPVGYATRNSNPKASFFEFRGSKLRAVRAFAMSSVSLYIL